jgi:hypothetical protein
MKYQKYIKDCLEKEGMLLIENRNKTLEWLDFPELINTINPYLLSYSTFAPASTIVRHLAERYVLSNEALYLDNSLKNMAIFINQKVYSGWKSGIKGIDLEFDRDGIRYIISIKSGPSWGNSLQIEKMINNFNTAKKTLRTSNSHLNIICINGCCYGKENNPDKGSYYKYCGQAFWEFIGGNETIYTDIIEPLGHKAKERNDDYMVKYSQMVNKFTKEFIELFCDNNGNIDWNKLVKFNSEKEL